MTASLRQGLAILVASCVVGFGANAVRREPLPMSGSIGPPPEPEPGADLIAISPEDALARWESGSVFVDVREPEAWDAGRVTGALCMAAAEFPQSYFALVPQPDPAIPLVVYGAGADSFAVRRVVAELGEMGHGDVAFLTEGFAALETAGLPTETAGGSMEETPGLSTEAAEAIP